ncbi:hypothetical protein NRB16_01510 [Pseudomonas sp. LJDD11]|uniref:hypothetical protein n=1 Tax=Pseudomonas sp. LJDD11 TaxID=2931984 RepID=UPI00211C31DE|nr:hypothetical protein [Pseudomonas sp. LJDD11]MCQ9422204.1 hypothetical protein [Pseudomonas sp. LJDD11]
MQVITDNAIAAALRARAQDAFGVAPAAPFTVAAVRPHRADVTYTVTSTLSCQVASRRVRQLTGEHCNRDYLDQVLQARRERLLANPGHFRPLIYQHLSNDVDHYRRPGQVLLTVDAERFCTREQCTDCNGHGVVHCSACAGHAEVRCARCRGGCHLHCHYCSGTGHEPERRRCGYCGGTGQYGNHRCSCQGGLLPADRCHKCHGQRTTPCPDCNARGVVRCTACDQGQVRCAPCEGAGELIHEYRLEVHVDLQVHYAWRNLSADWLEPVIGESVNGPNNAAVFVVDQAQADHPDPRLYTATGHVPAAEAEVSHEGSTGTCRFVGLPPIPLYLDGVLNGNFKKLLASMQDTTDIQAIHRASSSKIARQLIAENEQQRPIDQTTPVLQGIIDPEDGLEFLHKRAETFRHIVATRHRLRPAAVLGLSLPLTAVLFVVYLVMSFYLTGLPEPGTGKLGILALLGEPQTVGKRVYMQLLQAANQGLGVGMLLWFGAAIVFNRFSLPLLFPRLWAWAAGRWARILTLGVPGMLWLAVFMALYPTAEMWPDWRWLKFAFNRQGTLHAVTNALYLLPQIYLLALGLSLLRWRAAGTHWARRMMRILLQRKNVSAVEAQLH